MYRLVGGKGEAPQRAAQNSKKVYTCRSRAALRYKKEGHLAEQALCWACGLHLLF